MNWATTNTGFLKNYHIQNVSYFSLLPYFEYIIRHDTYRIQNPLRPVQKKEPPKKGAKRYRKMQAREKKAAKSRSVRNVLNLIDSLQREQQSYATA